MFIQYTCELCNKSVDEYHTHNVTICGIILFTFRVCNDCNESIRHLFEPNYNFVLN